MKTDKHKTKVKFLIHPKYGNEVFAFFPAEKWSIQENMFSSYAHIGQHSPCHIDYANECINATPEQYNDLKKELETIGYNLEIIN